MTNKEKFIEVFGLKPNEHFCPLNEEISCESCPYSKNGCDEDHKDRFFSMEYKESTTKNDLGVDCISRKKVIDTIFTECTGDKLDIDFAKVLLLQRAIKALPSVTPQESKTGHWIPTYGNVECSVCGSVKDSREVGRATHYCDFCGAKMVEPQESEG